VKRVTVNTAVLPPVYGRLPSKSVESGNYATYETCPTVKRERVKEAAQGPYPGI